jgi:integrase
MRISFCQQVPGLSALVDAAGRSTRKGMASAIGLDSSGYGTHSLRRTKAAWICRKTSNLRAVQLLLGHTKVDSNVRGSVAKFLSLGGQATLW